MNKILTLLLLTASCLLPTNSHGQAGSLDLTFGTGGIATTDFSGYDDFAHSVAIQTDGKIVVTGFNYNFGVTPGAFVTVRYNTDGTLDNTFDLDGKVTTTFGSDDMGNAVAIQTDGKIVVAGYSSTASANVFALARYNTDGSLDNTFDTDGKVTTAIGNFIDRGTSVAIQTDGKIVVAGTSANLGGPNNFALARYNTNGSLDNTFDTDGKVTTLIGADGVLASSMCLQTDGKILVAGKTATGNNWDFALARYNTNGSLDNTFDTDGIVTTEFGSTNDWGSSVIQQTDGKIVVAGISQNNLADDDIALARYNTNGSLDSTFDNDGKLTTAIGINDDAYSVRQQTDGKIIAAGVSQSVAVSGEFALVRYNSNGSLDNTFDSDGIVTTAIGGIAAAASSIAIQTDGKIVAAGVSDNGFDYDFAVARYHSGTVGIDDAFASLNLISVFPNPFSNELIIKGTNEKGVVILFDVMGNEILSQRTFNEATKISTENLSPGFYFLNYNDGNKTANIKLLKL